MKAQRKVHSLLVSLRFIDTDEPSENEAEGSTHETLSPVHEKRPCQLFSDGTKSRANKLDKGKEKDYGEEDWTEQNTFADERKPKKRVRFMDSEEREEKDLEEQEPLGDVDNRLANRKRTRYPCGGDQSPILHDGETEGRLANSGVGQPQNWRKRIRVLFDDNAQGERERTHPS